MASNCACRISALRISTFPRTLFMHGAEQQQLFGACSTWFVWSKRRRLCTSRQSLHSDVVHGEVTVEYQRGLPVVTVPLPSRRESCRFTLRPVSHTVGDFLQHVTKEDHGIDRIAVRTHDGVRVASSTSIETLMLDDFHLIVNDIVYHVSPPATNRLTTEEVQQLSEVRSLVGVLYEALNVGEHQFGQEREIHQRLEILRSELLPLETKRQELEQHASRRTSMLTWLGLGLMAGQFGILARLTWWEYSWDIMEPVTYFVTYGTTMACYAYFVLTKQDYVLPDVKDRQHVLTLHKQARKIGLDVSRYNELKNTIAKLEEDLVRLRDPLHVHLPVPTNVGKGNLAKVNDGDDGHLRGHNITLDEPHKAN